MARVPSLNSEVPLEWQSTGRATYVADEGNSTIRKISPAGVVSISLGLRVTAAVQMANAVMHGFIFLAASRWTTKAAYVADQDTVIRKITATGLVTTLAGTASSPGSVDATGPAARFGNPMGVAANSAGELYVADAGNHTIRKIAPGGVVTTFAGLAGAPGTQDGTGNGARFNFPNGVTVDAQDNIYVADTSNHLIRKITPGGVVSTVAGMAGVCGGQDGTGSAAQFAILQP